MAKILHRDLREPMKVPMESLKCMPKNYSRQLVKLVGKKNAEEPEAESDRA